jgi:hypothetical protein
MIFKRELKRAYRQLAVDPADIHLLGYKWRGHVYFDNLNHGPNKDCKLFLLQTCFVSQSNTNCEISAYLCSSIDIVIVKLVKRNS